MNNKNKQLKDEILKLEEQLYARSNNNKDFGVQTVPCKQIETLTLEAEKMKQGLLQMENINVSL